MGGLGMGNTGDGEPTSNNQAFFSPAFHSQLPACLERGSQSQAQGILPWCLDESEFPRHISCAWLFLT